MNKWLSVNSLAYKMAQEMRNRDRDNEFEEVELFVHHMTDRAALVSEFGVKDAAQWLPLSQIEIGKMWLSKEQDEKGKFLQIARIDAPVWLLKEKGFF